MGDWDESTQLRALPFVGTDRILVAEADPHVRAWLREMLAGHFGVEEVESGRAALERLTVEPPRVLVVGAQLADMSGSVLLSHAARHGLLSAHTGGPVAFTVANMLGQAPEIDENLVPVFYRLSYSLLPEQVRELLTQAIARLPPVVQKRPTEEDAKLTRQVIEHAKRLGTQPDLKSATRVAIAAVIELASADRARCLFYDEEGGTLWSETDGEDLTHASAGLAGFAVRARSGVVLPDVSADRIYIREIDDPQGTGGERMVVQPVADRDGRVHAVLIAVRRAKSPQFSEADLRKLEALAEAWAPFIHQLAQQQEAAHILEQREGKNEVFRQEAIDHLVRRGQRGDVVRVHPGWVHAAYWLLILFVVGAGAYVAFARVSQWSEGPAVIRVMGRTDIRAVEPGTVTALEVAPGESVTEGQILARLHDSEQAGRLRALNTEFERRLVAYLQTPAEPSVRQALSSLVTERESAQASVEARAFRAPHAGIVKEVHVANGQLVEAGKTIISLVETGATEGMSVLAFLPGQDRPRIRVGQRLRFTLPGYRGAHIELDVRAVSAEVIGAADARERYLGDRFREALPIQGSVVVIEGSLVTTTFRADDETYELHDGMTGFAEVRLQSRTILETLLPGG